MKVALILEWGKVLTEKGWYRGSSVEMQQGLKARWSMMSHIVFCLRDKAMREYYSSAAKSRGLSSLVCQNCPGSIASGFDKDW